MQERIKKFLQDIGLSEKETSVYLSLLPVDSASVIEIAKNTDINRTTLYPILDDLIKKNIITEVKEGKKVRFQAEPPERLETYIQNQKTKLEEQEKVLEDIIPQMRGFVRQTGEKPIVKIYEGREGILRSIQEYYQTGDTDKEEYLIYPRDTIKKLFTPKEVENAQKFRLHKNVKMNSIFTSTEEYKSDPTAERYQLRIDEYDILCEIGIYSDRVHIHTLSQNLSAIYIKSKDFAETLKTLFKLAVKGLKKD
jgi:sugar-specific transcriptional regulator TrmB